MLHKALNGVNWARRQSWNVGGIVFGLAFLVFKFLRYSNPFSAQGVQDRERGNRHSLATGIRDKSTVIPNLRTHKSSNSLPWLCESLAAISWQLHSDSNM